MSLFTYPMPADSDRIVSDDQNLTKELIRNRDDAKKRGLELSSHLDHRQSAYNKLIKNIERTYGIKHPKYCDLLILVPRTECAWEEYIDSAGMKVSRFFLLEGYWMPEWILAICNIYNSWKLDPTPEEYDEILSVLHEGLSGNLAAVNNYFGMRELAKETL